jgi:hypothetical protein
VVPRLVVLHSRAPVHLAVGMNKRRGLDGPGVPPRSAREACHIETAAFAAIWPACADTGLETGSYLGRLQRPVADSSLILAPH